MRGEASKIERQVKSTQTQLDALDAKVAGVLGWKQPGFVFARTTAAFIDFSNISN